MAKPTSSQGQEEGLRFCKEKIYYVDYKDTGCCASSSPTAARSALVG